MSKTPLVKIEDFYIKREDLNVTGSAKDRAIALQIENAVSQGFDKAVISSTGNAAISAAHFCRLHHINLTVFVSPHIPESKLKLIKADTLSVTPTPISDAFKFAKSHAYFLRQSTDPCAQVGYMEIGREIMTDLPEVSSIFVPVGSGTTLLGISRALPSNVKIFAVQPASHPPIASLFDRDFQTETSTVTDALSVKLLPLKNKVIQAIKDHQGGGLVVQNRDVVAAQKILASHHLSTSPEGALAFAGYYFKAKSGQLEIGSHPVILFTGANRDEPLS